MTDQRKEEMPDEIWLDSIDKTDDCVYTAAFRPECVKYIRAALLHTGWQPISTAPTNEWVLVFDVDDCCVARKIDNGRVPIVWCDSRGTREWLKPTHWQPLPLPPSDIDSGDG